MMREKNCCLCSQIDGDRNNDLIATSLGTADYVRRVPFESRHFAVIPSLGPLVPGHTLLCPKQHFKSFASLPVNIDVEYLAVRQQLTEVLTSVYGMPIHCFEHGTAKESEHAVCTVEHAHLHFVPTEVEVWEELGRKFIWEHTDGTISDLERTVQGLEYLFYGSPDGKHKVTKARIGTFESQYIRKVFAKALGRPLAWNWREVSAPHRAHETYETIKRGIKAQSTRIIHI